MGAIDARERASLSDKVRWYVEDRSKLYVSCAYLRPAVVWEQSSHLSSFLHTSLLPVLGDIISSTRGMVPIEPCILQ